MILFQSFVFYLLGAPRTDAQVALMRETTAPNYKPESRCVGTSMTELSPTFIVKICIKGIIIQGKRFTLDHSKTREKTFPKQRSLILRHAKYYPN
jgi:hypothetical protein